METSTAKRRRLLRMPAPWALLLALALVAPLFMMGGSSNKASAGLSVQDLQVFNVQAKQLSGPADAVVLSVPSGTVRAVIAVGSDAITKGEDCFGIAVQPDPPPDGKEIWIIPLETKCVESFDEVALLVLPIDPTTHVTIFGAIFVNFLSGAVGPGNVSKVDWGKFPHLQNLWLCTEPNRVEQCNSAVIFQLLGQPITSPDPKCPTLLSEPQLCDRQKLGAFEYELHFDPKFIDVRLFPVAFRKGDLGGGPGGAAGRDGADCLTHSGEGFIKIACLTKGKENAYLAPNLLSVVLIRPTADVYSIITANQENGIATQIINQGCNAADLQGHPIEITGDDVCQNGAITIRYLEGDVHADCVVDVLDQQQIAFRWGSHLGNLLYNSRMDLEPSQPKKGDGDIDAKDLQFVYGRHGSTCDDPHPKQVPVDPKAKPPTEQPPV